ncbi:MAG: DUF1801 domain-containing protein [Woeseiaceae bacterium]|nr:DUF1801 domain-containing protein [Woeseiaceae bacterium]
MAELKTKPTSQSVTAFMNAIEDKTQRADCRAIAAMMRKATGKRAKMWGSSMVGYGSYHYKYASGQEGDYFLTGFSPRKQATSVYIMAGFSGYDALMKKLGKHKTGKSCLYIKKLSDVDEKVLEQLIRKSVAEMRKKYPTK